MDDSMQAINDTQNPASTAGQAAASPPAQSTGSNVPQAVPGSLAEPAGNVKPSAGGVQSTEPVSISGHKELAPLVPGSKPLKENALTGEVPEELVQPSPPEVKIPQEVKEAGVEKSVDEGEVRLDKQAEQVGLAPAKESTPVATGPGSSAQLPMTFVQATQKKKTSGLWNSVTWLAGEIIYQWKKLKPDEYE